MPHFDLKRVFVRAWDMFRCGFLSYLIIFVLSLATIFFTAIIAMLGFLALIVGLVGTVTIDAYQQVFIAFFTVPGVLFLLVIATLTIVLSTLLKGMASEVTSQIATGYKADINVAFQWVVKRFWSYLGVQLLVAIGVLLGFILLIIPGLILLVLWFLAPYIVAREGLPAMAALARSRVLVTRGFGWTLLSILILLVPVIVYQPDEVTALSLLIALLVGLFMPAFTGSLYEELRGLEEPVVVPEPPTTEIVVDESLPVGELALALTSPEAIKSVKKTVRKAKPRAKKAIPAKRATKSAKKSRPAR